MRCINSPFFKTKLIMGRNHPESAAQFRSAQAGDRRPGWLRNKAVVVATLSLAVPGVAAALVGEGGTPATTPTPPSHSKIVDMTCHVTA